MKSTVFGSEFSSHKTATEILRGLCYKLRIMGIPIAGPNYMYGENMSVIYNTYRPESTLKNKYNSTCSHTMHEDVVMGKVMTANVRRKKFHRIFVLKGCPVVPSGIIAPVRCFTTRHENSGLQGPKVSWR